MHNARSRCRWHHGAGLSLKHPRWAALCRSGGYVRSYVWVFIPNSLSQSNAYFASRRRRRADSSARSLIGMGYGMAEGARRDPGSAKVLSKLLRRALFWGLVRTYPFPPALRALSPRNRRIVRDMWSIRRSGLFDSEWYLSRYPAYYVAWQMRPEAGAAAVRGSRPAAAEGSWTKRL
jgi:hypothetical protein